MSVCSSLLMRFLLLGCFLGASYAVGSFSSLQRTLVVTASTKQGEVLKAGEDNITVTWALNQTYPTKTGSSYKTIKVKLCYALISQVDRAWRKTEDDLKKDKTCQFKIVTRSFNPSNRTAQRFVWTIEKDVPTAFYFVRAYAYDLQDKEVAYGQSTKDKKTDIFHVRAVSGRHASLDIASACFSAFSILSLAFFFLAERRNGRMTQTS